MEKLAYSVIGAALAVVVMTALPNSRTTGNMPDTGNASVADTATDVSAMPGMGAMHPHPPREVSPDLPVPGVTHLMFPDVMDGYNIQILTRNFTFTPADINSAPRDNEGHAHTYVNEVKIARVYAPWYHLPRTMLQPGENEIKVTLNANDHGEWSLDGKSIASVVRVQIPNAE